MCPIFCVGNFKVCYVELPDLSIVAETRPRDLYLFLGGDLRHRVGVPVSWECSSKHFPSEAHRWSWIIFTHGTMFQPADGTDSFWLQKGRGDLIGQKTGTKAPLATRLEQLNIREELEPSSKVYQARTKQTARRWANDSTKCHT